MNGANNRDLGHEGTFLNISVQEVVLTPQGDKLGIVLDSAPMLAAAGPSRMLRRFTCK